MLLAIVVGCSKKEDPKPCEKKIDVQKVFREKLKH